MCVYTGKKKKITYTCLHKWKKKGAIIFILYSIFPFKRGYRQIAVSQKCRYFCDCITNDELRQSIFIKTVHA